MAKFVPAASPGAVLRAAGDRRHGSGWCQPSADPSAAVGPHSNEPAHEAVRKYPNRSAIMGRLYLDDPNGRDPVAHWKERPGMLGLRFYFNERHKREWMTDGSLDWLWPAAERHLCGRHGGEERQ